MMYNNHNLTGQNQKHSTEAGRRISKAVVETLEARQMMASSVAMVDGTLAIAGSDQIDNYMAVRLMNDGETIEVKVNTKTRTFALADIDAIQITGTQKNDIVRVDPRLSLPLDVKTAGGNDSVKTDSRAIHDGDVRYDGRSGKHVILNKTAGPHIASFTLINADTDEVIAEYKNLGDGMTVNLAKLPTKNLNIRANVVDGHGGSVKFAFDGETNIENIADYMMAGDNNNDYHAWTPATGEFKLSATPYTYNNAQGVKGLTKTITLNFTNSATPTNNKPVPTPQPAPTPTPTDRPEKPGPDNTGEVGAPVPVITAISRSISAGHSVHVNALASTLKSGTALHAKYEWNFGDAGSKYNTLVGWNAAHAYDKPGTYIVTLRVTNQDGKTATTTTRIDVAAANRRVIYVAANGSDDNSGRSPSGALKTFAKAMTFATSDTEILFRRSDTFTMECGVGISGKNVVIGAYGVGERPVMKYDGPRGYTSVFSVKSTAVDVTIRDVTIDSIHTTGTGEERMPNGVNASGHNVTVRNVEFLNLGYAVNANGRPTGLLVQDNVAPSTTALRGYLVWAQGQDVSIIGNTVKNVNGHVVRSSGANRVLIAHNNFSNPPEHGVYRGTLSIQRGEYIYVTGNELHDGVFAVGPLGNADGLAGRADRTNWVVVENNKVWSQVSIEHGAHHVMVRANTVYQDGRASIKVDDFDDTYGRGVSDVYVLDNIAVNNGSTGEMFSIGDRIDGITVDGNEYFAPKLAA